MTRAVVAGAWLAVCAGTAGAGGARKVDVTSDPAGASVYLDDVTTGEVCQTPCTVELPIGIETNIILQKTGYTPDIITITASRRGKIAPIRSALTAAIATLEIKDAAFRGAKILIDDVEKGQAPQAVQVEAGPHHVEILGKGGKTMFDDIVDIDAGDDHEIKPTPAAPKGAPKKPARETTTRVSTDKGPNDGTDKGPNKGPDKGSNDGTGRGTSGARTAAEVPAPRVTKRRDGETEVPSPALPRRRFVAVGGATDVGFRQFSYDHPNHLAATESEVGAVMLGPTLELWPIELLGGHRLRGLSLYGKVGFGINHQAVLDTANAPIGPRTYWGNIELDLRVRGALGDASSITGEAGYVRDQLEFTGGTPETRDSVPTADYRSVRIGLRAATMLGAVEPFAAVEGRIVLSGGELATRLSTDHIVGARIAAGAEVHAGPVYVRAQAALTYYGWTFTATAPDPAAASATGATDVIEVVSLVLGLAR